jgi:hypothetical protein
MYLVQVKTKHLNVLRVENILRCVLLYNSNDQETVKKKKGHNFLTFFSLLTYYYLLFTNVLVTWQIDHCARLK